MEGIIGLEDGTILRGRGFGQEGWVAAEMCFNTSMTGYEEILTDPSYRGQVVALTCPEIGNTGINPEDEESDRVQVAGLLVRRLSRRASNWRNRESLEVYLQRNKVPAVEGVDTRALTRKLRTQGAMKGVLATNGMSGEEAVRRAREWAGLGATDYVGEVTTKKSFEWDPEGKDFPGKLGSETKKMAPVRHRVAAIDCGMKRNILRLLRAQGIQPVVFPAKAKAEEILKAMVDGVFLSNGPGDPAVPTYVHATVRELIGQKPIFGICLGHQMLAHALGAKTFKLKFGHRGGNQPVKDLTSGKVSITSQNHGYAVDPRTLPAGKAVVTHVNLNDGTCEGIRLVSGEAFSVQYHPEAAPGPHDAGYFFKQFSDLLDAAGKKR
ncbi:MAG: carbamoyl-phosphate synthase small subunit [Verrucomicrobia bacterium]|nr:carbamoyl-phosphate synthase small subunit [Verrucomicrobiota bacterium]NDD81579.1 carbamoyl-phosphate synthase small subunit [Verrucomicrobiota bacterium]